MFENAVNGGQGSEIMEKWSKIGKKQKKCQVSKKLENGEKC